MVFSFSLLSLASILNKNVEIIYTQISSWGILEQLQVVKASEKKGKKNCMSATLILKCFTQWSATIPKAKYKGE